MNVRLTQCLCCGVALSFTLLQASQLRAQNQPFQMAGLCEAPQGISLSGLSPHRHMGGGNILGPHQGAGTFQIVDGSAEFSFDPNGNLIAFTASFTSGPNGYNFTSREGILANDYGVDPTGTSGVTGAVVITVLRGRGARRTGPRRVCREL